VLDGAVQNERVGIVGADVCRVLVRADGGQADIALPTEVPVGQLIPPVYDVLIAAGGALAESLRRDPPTRVYSPGLPPLDPTLTLGQQGIRDGCLLMLTSAPAESVPIPTLHVADAVQDAAHAQPRSPTLEQARLSALLVAVALTGVVGMVAVPDGIGMPSVLLGAAASATAAAISTRVSRYGRTTLMASTCLCFAVAAAALAATLFAISGPDTGLALAVLSVSVLTVPGRLSVLIAGLTVHIEADLDPDSDGVNRDVQAKAVRAQDLMSAIVVGASLAAVCGVVAATLATDRPRWPGLVAAGLIAALLIVRSRSHAVPVRQAFLLGAGTTCFAAVCIGVRLYDPGLTPCICVAAAAFAAGAIWLGFASPTAAGSVPVQRCLNVLDCLALVSVIPLSCWSSGVFDVVRGMNL
jgi:hypothetical protein